MSKEERDMKIEVCKELIASCEKNKCLCQGKMYLCIRCAMISDVKDELSKLQKEEFNLERWEGDEFIITKKGKPIGYTLTERNGKNILDWLRSAGEKLK